MLRSEIKKQAQYLLHRNYGSWGKLVAILVVITIASNLFQFIQWLSDIEETPPIAGTYSDYDLYDERKDKTEDDEYSAYEQGYEDGYEDGWNDGWDDGWDVGWEDAWFGEEYEEDLKNDSLSDLSIFSPMQAPTRQSAALSAEEEADIRALQILLQGALIGLLGLLFQLVVYLFLQIYDYFLQWAAIDNVTLGEVAVKRVLREFWKENGWRMVWAAVKVRLFTFLWSLLFIVPGIVKMLSYSMTGYLMKKDKALASSEAISLSRQLMKNYKIEYLVFTCSFSWWFLLNMFSSGLSIFYVIPYYKVSEVLFFDRIIQEKRHLFAHEREAGFTDF